MSETKHDKQIVSKSEYVRQTGQKTVLSSLGMSLLLFGVTGVGISALSVLFILLMWLLRWCKDPGSSIVLIVISLIGFVGAGCAAMAGIHLGTQLLEKAANMRKVVPLTRFTEHQLTPEQSLVRSSNITPTIQQAELLRATQAGQETPQEQLLRATTREE